MPLVNIVSHINRDIVAFDNVQIGSSLTTRIKCTITFRISLFHLHILWADRLKDQARKSHLSSWRAHINLNRVLLDLVSRHCRNFAPLHDASQSSSLPGSLQPRVFICVIHRHMVMINDCIVRSHFDEYPVRVDIRTFRCPL